MESGIDKLYQVFKSQNTILIPVETIKVNEIVEQISSLFAAGSFYYFIFNLVTMEFDYVSEGTRPLLGIEPGDYTFMKLLKRMHPEDQELMILKESTFLNQMLNITPREDITKYKTVYLMRLKSKDGAYKTYLQQVTALIISEDGKIQQTMGVHTDVHYLKIPFDHRISFIPTDSKLQSYYFESLNNEYVLSSGLSDKFTKREQEIIKLLGQGKRADEIADILYISKVTVNTHKKNILRKSNSKNSTELMVKCLRDGFI
ncbi:regulatory protein, luxR family [Flavobacteriaceae bacterium MAR_2010_188]|nr:regulatory protein, luxR family [Flavobacteriaceae bacterium MAR_2010_188]